MTIRIIPDLIRPKLVARDMLDIRMCESSEDFELAIHITKTYAEWLGIDLWFQDFDSELENFPEMYGSPRGVFLLGHIENCLAGGVGLRPLEERVCEMKRLYVFDQFKGKGVGKALCNALVSHAKDLGYEKMRLDTLEKMESARGLYRLLGFREIEAYCFNPEADAIYMELELS